MRALSIVCAKFCIFLLSHPSALAVDGQRKKDDLHRPFLLAVGLPIYSIIYSFSAISFLTVLFCFHIHNCSGILKTIAISVNDIARSKSPAFS